MALAFDSAADLAHTGNTSPQTFSLTTSGTDRVLYLTVANSDPATVPDTPTYNGVSMSLIDSDSTTSNGTWVYRLINPALGTNTVSISFGGAPLNWNFAAIAFNGADQTTPNAAVVKGTGNSATPSVDVSSATGKIVLGIIQVPNVISITAGAGQTQRTEELITDGPGTEITTEDGAASVTTSWTLDNSRVYVIFGYSLNPSGAPPVYEVTFVAAGSFAGNATLATQAITAPACAADDILICPIINKSVTANVVSPPDGTWTEVIATEVNDCTTAADDHQFSLFWKRATGSGGSFTFTKATDDNVLFGGVIVAYRGALKTGSPLDATPAARTKTAGAADNVTFPAYDPTSTNVRVIFVAFYGNDLTTFAAAMSADTNPDCTIDVDVESATGNDCSIAITSGINDGTNVDSRTWASASTTDAGNTGVVFALVAHVPAIPKTSYMIGQAVNRSNVF